MATSAPPDLRPLRSALRGAVAAPGDPGWDDARRAWNLAVDQHPAAVAQVASVDDVVAAIGFARATGLRVAPQVTGHGASRLGPLGATLLVRTAALDAVSVDPDARTARVGAGALWGPVVEQAGAHGLAALHGSSPTVGVAGYTLGGGLGWLARRHGLACNRVTAIDVVTADGEPRRVAGDDDLFWALGGGGGGYAVVTALEFELLPLTEIYAGTLFWPAEVASEVLHAHREWAGAMPDEMTSMIRLLHLPPLPQVPEPLRGVPVVDVGLAFAGDPAEGEALARSLREVATPMIDTLGMLPAPQLARLHGDPEDPVPGLGHHAVLRETEGATVDALLEVAGPGSGSPLVGVELRRLGGAVGRREPGHGALPAIDGEYLLYGVGLPMGPDVARAVQERLEALVAAMAPWSDGRACLNFVEQPGAGPAQIFDAETCARLQAVKAAVDPDDLLQANIPVPPAS